MSDIDWRQFLKDRGGLILAFVLAAVFSITVIQLAREWQGEIDYNASRNAADYATNANDDKATECGLTALQTRNNCSNEIDDAARKNQRDEYDLAAQQTMALWTAIMGGMAVIGVGLSGLGVYLIWRTWEQTQEAAGYSRLTYEAFISVEEANLYLRIMDVRKDTTGDEERWTFLMGVENLGKAPAVLHCVEMGGEDKQTGEILKGGKTANLGYWHLPYRALSAGDCDLIYSSGSHSFETETFIIAITDEAKGPRVRVNRAPRFFERDED